MGSTHLQLHCPQQIEPNAFYFLILLLDLVLFPMRFGQPLSKKPSQRTRMLSLVLFFFFSKGIFCLKYSITCHLPLSYLLSVFAI